MPSSGGKFIHFSPFVFEENLPIALHYSLTKPFAFLSLCQCSMMRSASFKGHSLDDHILSALVRLVHYLIFSLVAWRLFRSSHRYFAFSDGGIRTSCCYHSLPYHFGEAKQSILC